MTSRKKCISSGDDSNDGQMTPGPSNRIKTPLTRSSERIHARRNRQFTKPTKDEVFQQIPSLKSPIKSLSHLQPRKLVNNFTKVTHRYNQDPVDSTDDGDSVDDFIVADDEEEEDEEDENGESASTDSAAEDIKNIWKRRHCRRQNSILLSANVDMDSSCSDGGKVSLKVNASVIESESDSDSADTNTSRCRLQRPVIKSDDSADSDTEDYDLEKVVPLITVRATVESDDSTHIDSGLLENTNCHVQYNCKGEVTHTKTKSNDMFGADATEKSYDKNSGQVADSSEQGTVLSPRPLLECVDHVGPVHHEGHTSSTIVASSLPLGAASSHCHIVDETGNMTGTQEFDSDDEVKCRSASKKKVRMPKHKPNRLESDSSSSEGGSLGEVTMAPRKRRLQCKESESESDEADNAESVAGGNVEPRAHTERAQVLAAKGVQRKSLLHELMEKRQKKSTNIIHTT